MRNSNTFKTLLPSNSSAKERVLSEVINNWCLDYKTKSGLSIDINIIKALKKARQCPSHLLPYFAQEFSVDYWDESFTEDQKRALIASSFYVHSTKGTPASIKKIMSSAGFEDVELVEGVGDNNYNAKIHHHGDFFYGDELAWAKYRIKIKRPISTNQSKQVRKLLQQTAPARCELVGIEYKVAAHLYNNEINHTGLFAHGVA